MNLTDWYTGDQKPMSDRVGVYERDHFFHGTGYSFWDGKKFGMDSTFLSMAERTRELLGDAKSQSLPWRGIAEPGE